MFPREQQGESCQSTPLPNTTDPFTSLVVAVVACKKKGKEDGLTLLDLITFLQTLVSFPPLKAVGTGQVAIVKKDYRTGQIAVP